MPQDLVWLRYRQLFHISWWELITMPWDVVNRDLQILELEAIVKERK